MNATCDKCVDEKEPLCVKYCMYEALQISNKNVNEQEVKDND